MAEECTHNCDTCSANCSSKNNGSFAPQKLELSKNSKIKKIIGVSSGKGGVGKSFVTSLLASGLTKKGYKTAILDADILGPSIPKSFGIINDGIRVTDDNLMLPKETKTGIKIMSSNLLLSADNEPIIYRGSLIAGVLQQFYTDTMWGDDIDYMFIDMPPGTGDVPLTTYQSIPIDYVVIVSSPQGLVSMIVEKSINMAKKMNIPILGIMENMSYVECPDCKKKIEIFGHSNMDEICKENNINLLAKLPLREEYVEKVDNGNIEDIDIKEIDEALSSLEKLLK